MSDFNEEFVVNEDEDNSWGASESGFDDTLSPINKRASVALDSINKSVDKLKTLIEKKDLAAIEKEVCDLAWFLSDLNDNVVTTDIEE